MGEYYKNNLIIKEKEYNVIFNVPESRIFSVSKNIELENVIDKINEKCKKTLVPKKLESELRYRKLIVSCAETCNLRCKYCFANEGTYNESDKKIMNDKDYDKLFDFLKSLNYRLESMCLFGGEPLLGFQSIKRFMKVLKNYYDENNWDLPRLGIVTNGTLIDKEMVDFFEEYNFIVSVSIDGDKCKNDANRVFKSEDRSVYSTIANKMHLFKDKNFILTASATFSRSRILNYSKGDYEKTVEHLNELGFDIAECFLADEKYEVTEQEKNNIKLFAKEQIRYLFKEIKSGEKLKCLPKIPLGIVSTIVKKKYTAECPAGRYLFYYTAEGEIYPCQMYYAANIKESHLLSRTENKECSNCFAVNICSGYCPGSSVLANASENSVVETRCIFNKALIEESILQINRYINNDFNSIDEIKSFCKNIVKLSKEY